MAPTTPMSLLQEEHKADIEAKTALRIEQVKETILRKLNLGTAPNVSGMLETSNPKVQAMIDEVNTKANEANHESPSDFVQDQPVQRKAFIRMEEGEHNLELLIF